MCSYRPFWSYFQNVICLERSFNNALPPPLSRSNLTRVDPFETTNGFYHNRKSISAPLRNVKYKRAPGSSYVTYMKHNLEESGVKLIMGVGLGGCK